MEYLPPYVIYNSHSLTSADIDTHVTKYKKLLTDLRDEQFDNNQIKSMEYFNDILD